MFDSALLVTVKTIASEKCGHGHMGLPSRVNAEKLYSVAEEMDDIYLWNGNWGNKPKHPLNIGFRR